MFKLTWLMGYCLIGLLSASNEGEPSLDSDILPWMTKLGCNAGNCHGSAAGRGGFHLSLFASDPAADYEAIVHELEGRRIDRIFPERSLVLAKPTGYLDHGGGIIAEDDSPFSELLAAWIGKGAKRTSPRATLHLDVQPIDVLVSSSEELVELQIRAQYSDGHEETVMSKSSIVLPDDGSVSLVDENKLRVLRPGQHTVLVRFMDKVVAVTLSHKFADAAIPDDPRAVENTIDKHIVSRLRDLGLTFSPAASDSRWLRRVTLDLTGRLPTLDELNQFQSESSSNRYESVVDRLLSSEAFVDFWTFRLGRWLKIHEQPKGRAAFEAYRNWLRQCVALDVGFDRMVRELLLAEGDSHENGAANFHRLCEDARKEAEVVARLFMGTRMECANCHDHPLDRWKQDDYHGFAALFAGVQRERVVKLQGRGVVHHPKTGESATPRIPGIAALAQTSPTIQHFADWLTASDNAFFAPAIVNMLWKQFFGRGLVDPYNDFRETNPASHPPLLQELAKEMGRDGYRLRPWIKRVVLSNTYRTDSEDGDGESIDPRFYAKTIYRPLEAEVYVDAIRDVLMPSTRDDNGPHGVRAIHPIDRANASSSLQVMNGCMRQDDCSADEVANLGLAAQLHLMNSDLINALLTDPNGQLQIWERDQVPIHERLENIFLRALTRNPTTHEWNAWNDESKSRNPDEQTKLLEDLVWSLLVSKEFRCNH